MDHLRSNPASRNKLGYNRRYPLRQRYLSSDRLFLPLLFGCLILLGLLLWLALFKMHPAPPEVPLVTLEIRYTMPAANKVLLVWGVDGWKEIPEAMRMEGTVVKGGVMNTPMVNESGVFVSRITLPAWTRVEYGFVVQELIDGSEPGTWEGNDDYELTTSQRDHQIIEVKSSIDPDSP